MQIQAEIKGINAATPPKTEAGVDPQRAVLVAAFDLSQELAEHIAYVAHTRGVARLVSRPRQVTERLTRQGHALAQLNGFLAWMPMSNSIVNGLVA